MALVRVQDGAGHGIDLVDIDGYRICSFDNQPEVIATRFRDIKSFPCNNDDVFICAPVKSGTHWTWEIVSMLLNGQAVTIPKRKSQHMLECVPHEQLGQLSAPRVLNTHVNYEHLPDQMKEKKCKILHVLRNPKDMLVSWYHHDKGITSYRYDGEWGNLFPLFFTGDLEYGSWFDYVLEMEDLMENSGDVPILKLYFEDLKENNLTEVYRIGEFLGVENTDNLFEKVSEKCTFRNMKEDKVIAPEIRALMYKEDYSMYRKGEIGDWKNYFTVAQNELFDKVYEERMKTSKLKFRHSYKETPQSDSDSVPV